MKVRHRRFPLATGWANLPIPRAGCLPRASALRKSASGRRQQTGSSLNFQQFAFEGRQKTPHFQLRRAPFAKHCPNFPPLSVTANARVDCNSIAHRQHHARRPMPWHPDADSRGKPFFDAVPPKRQSGLRDFRRVEEAWAGSEVECSTSDLMAGLRESRE
jgi:hypothetical protein